MLKNKFFFKYNFNIFLNKKHFKTTSITLTNNHLIYENKI
jgi:hypothetical protein